MTKLRLNLLVIRSEEPARTIGLYELLDMRFQEEQHGKGPIHWASECGGWVMEVYSAMSPDDVDGTTRLGFDVDEIESILISLRDLVCCTGTRFHTCPEFRKRIESWDS